MLIKNYDVTSLCLLFVFTITVFGQTTTEQVTTEIATTVLPTGLQTTTSVLQLDAPSENTTVFNATDFAPISGRSSKSLKDRGREGRIINDGGKKFNIKGFIPIVSLDEERHKQDQADEDEDDGPIGPYPPQPIPPRPSDPYPSLSGPYPPQSIPSSVPFQRPPVSYPGISGSSGYLSPSSSYLGQYDDQPYRGISQAISGFSIRGPKRDSAKPSFFPVDIPDVPLYQDKKPGYSPAPVYQEKPHNRPLYSEVSNGKPKYLPGPSNETPNFFPSYPGTSDEKPKYLPSYPGSSNEKPSYLPPYPGTLDKKPDYLPPYPGTLDKKPDYLPSLPSSDRPTKYPPPPVFQEQKPKQFGHGIGQFEDSYQDAVYEQPGAGFGQQDLKEPCVCVPFYLCKGGYLDASAARNVNPQIDERSARKAESKSKRSTNTTVSAEFKSAVKNETPAYAEDIMSRFIGQRNENCGILRRCCRVRSGPIGQPLPEFGGPGGYPVAGGDISSDFHPQFLPEHISGGQFISRPQPDQLGGAQVHPGQTFVRPPNDLYGPIRPGFPGSAISSGTVHRPVVEPIRQGAIDKPYYGDSYDGQYLQKPVGGPHRPPVLPPPIPQHYPPQAPPKPVRPAYGVCGARNAFGVHGRINNLNYREDSSEFGEYPWQVAILKKIGPGDSLYVCGGTLVGSQWVLTAAHCMKKHSVHELKIRLGEWDVHREDEFYPHMERLIADVVVHPEFFPGNLNNDLALLRFDSPVDLNQPHVAAACLPEPHEKFSGQRCWVTGWGKDAFGKKGEYQNVLKEVDVPVIHNQECEHRLRQTRLGPQYNLHPGFMCAGGEPGKDACTGDGGSPLVCEAHGVWKVTGLVSWGIGCGQPGVPGVYVNIGHYRGWIESIIHQYG